MKELGKLIHMVDVKLKRRIDLLAAQYDLTSIQFIVMELIYLTPKEQDLFQKDLEAAFDVRRSTISNILGLLERKGYIIRESVPTDARLKKLLLTPSGETIYLEFKAHLKKAQAEDFKSFSQEERDLLFALLKRLLQSLQ